MRLFTSLLAAAALLILSGCLPRPPHGFWETPAVEVRGDIPDGLGRADSVRVVRASFRLDDSFERTERRIASLLNGDTTQVNEYFQVRTVPIEEGGAFVASFPPVLYYGALYQGQERLIGETLFVRLPTLRWEALAIPLDPPHESVTLSLVDWKRHGPADDISIRVAEKHSTAADTSRLLTVELEVR